MDPLPWNHPVMNVLRRSLVCAGLLALLAPTALLAQTTGTNSYAAGGAVAPGTNAVGIGNGAAANGFQSTVVGANSTGNGFDDSVFGVNNNVNGGGTLTNGLDGASVFGNNNTVSASGAVVMGSGNTNTGTNSVLIGTGSTTNAANTILLGQGVNVQGAGGIGIGTGAQVGTGGGLAIGANASADNGCSAIGSLAACNQADTLSVGNAGLGFTTRITNVAAGVAPNDAVNVSQLTGALGIFGSGAGMNSGAIVNPNYTFGAHSFNNVGAALNFLYGLDGTTSTGPTGPVSSTDPNAVHYDDSTDSTVTLQGANGTTITNVAPGVISPTSTDAVNGAQLYGAVRQSENWAKAYTDQAVSGLNDRISRVMAASAASASMASNFREMPNSFAVGLGLSGGHNGIAVGYRHISESKAVSWSIQGAIAGSERSIGVGIGYGW